MPSYWSDFSARLLSDDHRHDLKRQALLGSLRAFLPRQKLTRWIVLREQSRSHPTQVEADSVLRQATMNLVRRSPEALKHIQSRNEV